ncbi:MAG: multidrug DMT transporter permease [Armatimonadota bacterium]
MTSAAIALLVFSAIIHATWNMIGKREDPSAKFFLIANTMGVLLLSPVVLSNLSLPLSFPVEVWKLIAITGLFQAVYFMGLAGAYRAGHLSVAYPLARSAPVLMVAVISILMGKGSQLTSPSIVGMVLVAIGGLLLPINRIADWKLRDYLHASTLFALLAAVGTSGYSLADDAALRVLKEQLSANRVILTLNYAFFEGISTFLWLGLLVLIGQRNGKDSAKSQPVRFRHAMVAGIGICLAYTIVLLAMTLAKNVSYIVAFRQLSIPIGAVLGVTVLREPGSVNKFVAITVMLAGLVLVAVY